MISITKVTPDDADTLLQLSFKTFEEAFKHQNDPDDYEAYIAKAFTRKKILSEILNPNSAFYFAMDGDEPVGYIKLNTGEAQNENQDKNYLEVERIYLLASQQGKRIGEQLINFAIDTARENGCECIWLGVWEHNLGALRFYGRHGFEVYGNHQFMLGNDEQTDVLMIKKLS